MFDNDKMGQPGQVPADKPQDDTEMEEKEEGQA